MKISKTNLMAVTAFVAILGLAAFAAPATSASNDDWQVIKNAVKEEARPEAVRGEPKWFKILIMDRHSREETLKITLPLSFVEGLLKLAEDKHVRCDDIDEDLDFDLDLDFEEILDQLKKAGPMALIEITGDDGLIKIWIE